MTGRATGPRDVIWTPVTSDPPQAAHCCARSKAEEVHIRFYDKFEPMVDTLHIAAESMQSLVSENDRSKSTHCCGIADGFMMISFRRVVVVVDSWRCCYGLVELLLLIRKVLPLICVRVAVGSHNCCNGFDDLLLWVNRSVDMGSWNCCHGFAELLLMWAPFWANFRMFTQATNCECIHNMCVCIPICLL